MTPSDADRRAALMKALTEIRRQQEAGEIGPEQGHRDADAALLAYLNDTRIAHAFEAIERWYA